jgi:acetylornithine deacetylase/succinyl-diaminopimelate desuccinylase-like protein
MGLEMTVYGPNRALHSGHYGNWSPNPAVDLANIIARLRDDRGRMATEAFAQSAVPPSQAEWQAIQQFPNVESSLKKELGLSRSLTDMRGQGQRVESSVLYPAMNIRGIRAGNVGDQATNSVMTEASASIDFRLVPNQTPENVREQFESWLKATGHTVITDDRPMTDELRATNPPVVRLRWQPGYPPMRTSFDNAAAQAMVRTIEAAFPKQTPLLRLPTLGGSVPMYLFQQQFKVPAMILPIANYDNNQHAANENIRLGNLWQGIELYAALMAELGKQWK